MERSWTDIQELEWEMPENFVFASSSHGPSLHLKQHVMHACMYYMDSAGTECFESFNSVHSIL